MNASPERSRMPSSFHLVEYRVGELEKAIQQISAAVKMIAESTSQIASLEQRHTETREAIERAFHAVSESNRRREALDGRVNDLELKKATAIEVKELGGRITNIEIALPSLKKSSRWIDAGLLLLAGLLVVTAIKAALNF